MKIIYLLLIICIIVINNINCEDDAIARRVYVGQNVQLRCGPIDQFVNIPMKFQWERPLGNVIGNQPILKLDSVDFKDGGTYTCRVTHKLNNNMKENVLSTQLLISSREGNGVDEPTDPPKINFKKLKSNVLNVKLGGYLYATCDVTNWQNDEYTIRWLKNSRVMAVNKPSLFVYPFKETDAGVYTCEVRHKKSPQQVYQRLLNVVTNTPTVNIEPLSGDNIVMGGRVHKKCEMTGDQYRYSWIKEGSGIVSSNEVLDIPINSMNVAGRYTCIVTSPSNQEYRKYVDIVLSDTNPPINRGGDIKVNIFTTPMNPLINKPFTLTCDVTPPTPGVRYEWTKDNQMIAYEQKLIINSFEKSNIGAYSCRVRLPPGISMSGPSVATEDIQFQLTTKNRIELSESGTQMISKVGDKRELHCEIKQSSNTRGTDVTWFFNGRPLDNSYLQTLNIYRTNRIFVSILTLNSITMANEGEYKCEVNGVTQKSNLVVLDTEKQLFVNPELLDVKEGEPAEFHCRLSNMPGIVNTQMRWSFRPNNEARQNGGVDIADLNSPNRWEIRNMPNTPETSFISISRTLITDSGFYMCTIPSGLSKVAELRVRRTDTAKITITPREIRTRPSQPIVIECFSVSSSTGQPYGNPEFRLGNNGPQLTTNPRFQIVQTSASRIQLQIPSGLSLQENGMRIDCVVPESGAKDTSVIYLEDACPPNFRKCNTGQCLSSSQFCDGIRNCQDGSDEDPTVCNKCDPLIRKCEYYSNSSPLKPSFLVHWRCDGEDDCGNGFDESSCQESDRMCNKMNFRCADGKMIPRAYQCDKEMDCSTNEDEMNCVAPQVSATDPGRPGDVNLVRRVRRGGSITLECTAFGNPLPVIEWRMNWNCLRDKLRMIAISRTEASCTRQISTLTITDFQPGDDGIYNCEALAGEKRAFSKDFQLILES